MTAGGKTLSSDLRRIAPPAGGGGWGGGTAASIGATIDAAAGALAAAGFDEPRRRARGAVAAALDLSDAEVFARPERQLDAVEQAKVAGLLRRLLGHEPLSRILGRREFWGLDFALSSATLDPRPETETVVEAVLARLLARDRRYRFLDLGTGTGCLLLALLHEFPRASGVGVDIAADAAGAARGNAERLGLAGRARFVVGDWARAIGGPFDAIVANPPYIATGDIALLPPEVREHDPRAALDGGVDGLAAYRAVASGLTGLLAPGGIVAVEVGIGQAAAVAAIFAVAGLATTGVERDLAGIERCVVTAAKCGDGTVRPG